MLFSSVTFLTAFLPLTAVLYYLPKIFVGTSGKSRVYNGYRNFILLLVSLIFYAWGEPRNIILMLLSIAFNYTATLHIDGLKHKPGRRKAIFIFSTVFNIGLLVFFKYSGFIAENISALFGLENRFIDPALPIGISFYTFQIMSYVICVYKKKTSVQRSPVSFALYISMFPQLIAGPIVEYSQIDEALSNRKETFYGAADGIFEFIKGLAKKTILANSAGAVYEMLIGDVSSELSLVSSWTAIIFYAFQIYFDFSGYSDMAKGLGGIFGFTFPDNFSHPYMATSVTDFWRRWHITLSSWFRDYVYIPLGGNRCSRGRQIFNLFVVWSLTGLWHGASWNFLLWGIYYFFLLVLEKNLTGRLLEKLPVMLRRIITFVFVLFGWVLFSSEDLSAAARLFESLFGLHGITNANSLYVLSTNAVMLVIMAVLSTDIFSFKEENKDKTHIFVLRFAVSAALFIVSLVYLIGDTYNPFLYFRF